MGAEISVKDLKVKCEMRFVAKWYSNHRCFGKYVYFCDLKQKQY